MRHFRVSIRGLIAVIVLLGVGFAALRFPTPFWANVWYSITVSALTLAVPAAVYRQGKQRAFWVGFATCGWVYFALALAPWFQGEAGFQFVTTTLLDLMAPYIVRNDDLVRGFVGGFNPQYSPVQPTPWQVWNLPEFTPDKSWHKVGYVTLVSPGIYLRIGHAFFCVVVGALGGGIVCYLSATRSRPADTER